MEFHFPQRPVIILAIALAILLIAGFVMMWTNRPTKQKGRLNERNPGFGYAPPQRLPAQRVPEQERLAFEESDRPDLVDTAAAVFYAATELRNSSRRAAKGGDEVEPNMQTPAKACVAPGTGGTRAEAAPEAPEACDGPAAADDEDEANDDTQEAAA